MWLKKRKLKNIAFKKAFHQCSLNIFDVIFGGPKIYIWHWKHWNQYNLSGIKKKNKDAKNIYFDIYATQGEETNNISLQEVVQGKEEVVHLRTQLSSAQMNSYRSNMENKKSFS